MQLAPPHNQPRKHSVDGPRYPLLEALLQELGLELKGRYTNGDVANIFGVTTRTIEKLQAKGRLKRRELPGHAKCLSCDLEDYLQNSEAAYKND